ncbi:lipoprotein [Streptomyces viridochromogenes]|uniref:Lipoprotein n=1 Tax=Streptomyces viridochromogenes TaxID=1938 RepID=A0A0J8CH94_STRVR|nr:lipoprotein [Streptomyces viridochromogenes]KOG19098.1 lipoprotein [Streptomyces viridochromogenes]KOG19337.1 lipoprotein [Streptomyces viridochromogenes]
MRTTSSRTVGILTALGLFAAGCGGGAADAGTSEPAPDTGPRAREVARAWEGSPAAENWRKGYHPVADPVQLPEDAFHNDADKEAYTSQNFELRGDLPETPAKDARVTWRNGDSLTLPLMRAREAYEQLDRNSSPGPRLTVTGAKLGETTLATSRGPATVPAWLFTLDGYDTPLKRVALAPSKPPKAPIGPVGDLGNDLWELGKVVEVAADGRSATVLAHHGACDDGPAVDVLETDGSVVLSGYMVGQKEGPCTAQLLAKKVTVELGRPLGDRILLDAFTGRPVRGTD